MAQIENAQAVANVEEIAAVPGINVLFIGHSDLSLNLGVYGKFDSPEKVRAEEAVLHAAQKHGKIPCMLLIESMDPKPYRERFRFLAPGTDHRCMKQAFSTLLKHAAEK